MILTPGELIAKCEECVRTYDPSRTTASPPTDDESCRAPGAAIFSLSALLDGQKLNWERQAHRDVVRARCKFACDIADVKCPIRLWCGGQERDGLSSMWASQTKRVCPHAEIERMEAHGDVSILLEFERMTKVLREA